MQMKRKQLTKPFMNILSWQNPFVSKAYTKVFQRCKGYDDALY